MKDLPHSLPTFFKIHFVVDLLFALPLMIAPLFTFKVLGFEYIDIASSENITLFILLARLTAAALIGIGGASLWMHKSGPKTYKALLQLKLLWSASAILALSLALASGFHSTIFLLLLIFIAFFALWFYFYQRLC